jgi:hypothetical protein
VHGLIIIGLIPVAIVAVPVMLVLNIFERVTAPIWVGLWMVGI